MARSSADASWTPVRQLLMSSASFGGCCAADPRHMLSSIEPDNFEGLAVAAEVIALGKKAE